MAYFINCKTQRASHNTQFTSTQNGMRKKSNLYMMYTTGKKGTLREELESECRVGDGGRQTDI
jgi:hypothetical protein